jgi:hypothetical protein
MKLGITTSFLAASLLAVTVSSATLAATVTYVGNTTKANEAIHWRTPAVKKSLDLDGDKIYGTIGDVVWVHGSSGEQQAGSTALGWMWVGSGAQFSLPAYVNVDDEQDATKSIPSGLVLNNFDFQLMGSPSDFDGKTVRVGVMEDMLGKDENAADNFKALQVVQTGGDGKGDSGVQTLRSGGSGTGSPMIYFFDIKGAKAGDTFSIKALNNQGGTSGNAGYVGPVSWDIANAKAK